MKITTFSYRVTEAATENLIGKENVDKKPCPVTIIETEKEKRKRKEVNTYAKNNNERSARTNFRPSNV